MALVHLNPGLQRGGARGGDREGKAAIKNVLSETV